MSATYLKIVSYYHSELTLTTSVSARTRFFEPPKTDKVRGTPVVERSKFYTPVPAPRFICRVNLKFQVSNRLTARLR